jgi:hypothetical protein
MLLWLPAEHSDRPSSSCPPIRPAPALLLQVRRRRGVFDAVGWRSADHQGRGPAASRPHGPPDDGPDTTRPSCPDPSGRHPANGPDDEPHTRPRAGHSQGRHSRRPARPGRSVGRGRRPGWSGRRPGAGWGRHPGPGGSRLAAAWSWSVRVAWRWGSWWPWSPQGSSWWPWWLVAWRVTRTRVSAPSQASRRHPSASSGPSSVSPPRLPARPWRLSRSTSTVSWGRTPPVWGNRPPSSWRRANSARASARRWPPLRSSAALGAGQRFQGGQQGLAGLGFQQPIHCDHALQSR